MPDFLRNVLKPPGKFRQKLSFPALSAIFLATSRMKTLSISKIPQKVDKFNMLLFSFCQIVGPSHSPNLVKIFKKVIIYFIQCIIAFFSSTTSHYRSCTKTECVNISSKLRTNNFFFNFQKIKIIYLPSCTLCCH